MAWDSLFTCKARPYHRDSLFSLLVLGCCVITICLITGFHYTFGLILPDLMLAFKSSRAETGWIGSLGLAINFSMGPLSGYFCRRFGESTTAIIGSLVSFLGLFLTSFVKHLPVAYLTYGIIYGTGSSFGYTAVYNTIPKYFNRWRSASMGVLSAGAQLGTICMSPMIHVLLTKYDWMTTYQIMSSLVLSIVILSLVYSNTVLQSEDDVNTSSNDQNVENNEDPSSTSTSRNGAEHLRNLSNIQIRSNSDFSNDDFVCRGDLSNTSVDKHHIEQITSQNVSDLSPTFGLNKSMASNDDVKNIDSQKSDNDTVSFGCLDKSQDSKGVHCLFHDDDESSRIYVSKTGHDCCKEILRNSNVLLDDSLYDSGRLSVIEDQGSTSTSLTKTIFQQSPTCATKKDKDVTTSSTESKKHGLDFTVWKNPAFTIFTCASTISMLAFYVPLVYLADYCKNIGIGGEKASQLYIIIAIASMCGRLLSGFICDVIESVKPLHIAQFSLVIAGLTLSLTPFAKTFETILCTQIVYGTFTGAVRVQYPLVVMDYIGVEKMSQGWGFLMFTHSFAIASGVPLAGLFADQLGSYTKSFHLAGGIIALGALIMTSIYCVTKTNENKMEIKTLSVSSLEVFQPMPILLVTTV